MCWVFRVKPICWKWCLPNKSAQRSIAFMYTLHNAFVKNTMPTLVIRSNKAEKRGQSGLVQTFILITSKALSLQCVLCFRYNLNWDNNTRLQPCYFLSQNTIPFKKSVSTKLNWASFLFLFSTFSGWRWRLRWRRGWRWRGSRKGWIVNMVNLPGPSPSLPLP